MAAICLLSLWGGPHGLVTGGRGHLTAGAMVAVMCTLPPHLTLGGRDWVPGATEGGQQSPLHV